MSSAITSWFQIQLSFESALVKDIKNLSANFGLAENPSQSDNNITITGQYTE